MAALLEDSSVAEIMVDGPDRVYVERKGKLEDVDVRFADRQEIVGWANGLLASHGCEPVGEGRLWVEGRLRDGTYVLVVIPPVAVDSPSVVIKKPSPAPLTFDQLLQWGSISQPMLDFLEVVMRAKLAMIIAGGTGSGKTTLTRMVAELVPEGERLVVVGEAGITRFLHIRHKHLVCLEAQPAIASGAREADVGELLRLAARMRPDRIVYGELGGGEVLQVLQFVNLGHEGMVATIHANSPRDVLTRMETMATIAEPGLTLPVIRSQIAGGIDLIIQQDRLEDGTRKVISIAEVQGLKGDNIVLQELFTWERTGVGEDGRFTGAFKATGAVPSFAPALAAAGLTFPEGLFEQE
jgi:pilus assembly protein CpaF